MDQKEDANDVIIKIIKDGCQLLIMWIKKKREILD